VTVAVVSIANPDRRDPKHPTTVPMTSSNYSQFPRVTLAELGNNVMMAIDAAGEITQAFYVQNGWSISVRNAQALRSESHRQDG
jgi:hypothetical protein